MQHRRSQGEAISNLHSHPGGALWEICLFWRRVGDCASSPAIMQKSPESFTFTVGKLGELSSSRIVGCLPGEQMLEWL